MNPEKLRYIVEVAKSGSIKLASKTLHISESAISQSISSFERELGIKIFIRSRGQDTLLTDDGKRIVQKAYEILIKYEELQEVVDVSNVNIKGKIILSTIAGYMNYLIDPLSQFKDLFPNVRVEIIDNHNLEVIEGIHYQKYDIGLIACYGDVLKGKKDIDFHLLCDGRAKIYVSRDSYLSNKKKVALKELQDHNLIAYKGDYTQMFINKYAETLRPLNILFKSNNTETVLNAVSSGLGFAISYDFLMNQSPYIKNGQIIALDIIENPLPIPLDVSFGWICSKKRQPSSISKRFLKIIESNLKD